MATSIISVRVQDGAAASTATTNAYVTLDTANTIAGIGTALGAWLTALQATMSGKIVSAYVKLGLDVSGFAGHSVAEGIPVSAGGALIFKTQTEGTPWDFVVPSRNLASVVGGKFDTGTDGSVVDVLADLMENGATAGTTSGGYVPISGLTGASYFTNSEGEPLYGPAGGRLITRKHRKQLGSKSASTGA